MQSIAPLLIGFAFGWLLQKAGLSRYDRIVNVFRFRDLAVLKFLLSALVTAAIGIRCLQALGWAEEVPIPSSYLVGNLVGGVVFGVGMALSGFCPGTVAAGAGEGRLDYLVPGGLGLFTGAVGFGLAYDHVMPALSRWGRLGPVTLADLLHADPWLVVVAFTEIALLVFYFVERGFGLRASALLLLLGLFGCPSPSSRTPIDERRETLSYPIDGVPIAGTSTVRVSLDAPTRASYVPEMLGIAGQSVSLRLTNGGKEPVSVRAFQATFEATRSGVPFPCTEHDHATVKTREPSILLAGQSFRFERDLDCRLTLPGHYVVGLRAAWGDEAESERAKFSATFALDVIGEDGPRPYASRPGLFVLLTGARATRPLPQEAWARGDYHVVVAVVNGGKKPVSVGPGSLAFLTYKKGSALPCSGKKEELRLPEELLPGVTYVTHAPVACAPNEEGRYQIVGKLALAGGEEIEIGRVALTISRDPILFLPEAGSSWRDGSPGEKAK